MLLKQGNMHAFGSPGEVLTPKIIDQVYGVEARLATVGDYAAPLIYYPAQ
jgi:iron complex transport system ATP-binding protein